MFGAPWPCETRKHCSAEGAVRDDFRAVDHVPRTCDSEPAEAVHAPGAQSRLNAPRANSNRGPRQAWHAPPLALPASRRSRRPPRSEAARS
eukprot:11222-Alexandrium_andersonii.AAC.1